MITFGTLWRYWLGMALLRLFMLAVCAYGYFLDRRWAQDTITLIEWSDLRDWYGNDFRNCYIEEWRRQN